MNMRFAIYILSVMVIFFLAGAVKVGDDSQVAIFHTPAFMCLTWLLCTSSLLCCVRKGLKVKHIGFHLTHVGVVVIALGALIGHRTGIRSQFAAPIHETHLTDRIPLPEGDPVNLDFQLGVKDFEVERYDPDYALYKPGAPPEDDNAFHGDYIYVDTYHVAGLESVDLGEAGVIETIMLKTESGAWLPQLVLDGGWVLQKQPAVDKWYRATLILKDDESGEQEFDLAVNRPVKFKGWGFYLMSYDREQDRYIVIDARKDPGRNLVISGIYALMIGITALCWQGIGRRK